ncbi:heptaprenylglyceryl phosphate synthase [Ureibacillus thermophilus]|uniref:Heptaprenylglyceryl phosphate synthase n=1 Tax=Ureibacillus thermophilus TaxID=367743 RepID=A0A4P6UMV5_9BACL|nr:heptaprenylglyceryl phosphate synthase [Ureibacillus thermophilus]QBK24519.1 heptaprenylglyceryl phosphate synthase [Ureibacillus thermophilus]
MDYKNWRHVFKIDPSKELSDEALEKVCESGTDVIIVGGTDDVTLDNVLEQLVRIRRYSVPVALEISTIESITPGFDYYLIPTVLNSTNTKWVKDLHHAAIKEYGDIMVWDELIAEGYCILNPECKAAIATEAEANLSEEDVVAYARLAENYFKLPIFYLEYSGTYGDVEIVKAVKAVLNDCRLFYGGGIKTKEQAKEMAQYADTVIVGNVIYENLDEALKTVEAVKSVKK